MLNVFNRINIKFDDANGFVIIHAINMELPVTMTIEDSLKDKDIVKLFMPLFCLLSFILIASNITALKLVYLEIITLTGGFVIVSFIYIINDILIECYGYKNIRQAIWYSFSCAVFSILIFFLLAFYGKKDTDLLSTTIGIATVKKTSFQFLLYPVTLFFIIKVKRIEKN